MPYVVKCQCVRETLNFRDSIVMERSATGKDKGSIAKYFVTQSIDLQASVAPSASIKEVS